MEKFSVLMPIYYKEKPDNLKEALKSITESQTVLPNEILIIEDGILTPNLDEVIESYQKKYSKIFKIIKKKENKGLGIRLQEGVLKCKYDLIARMDSDDIASPVRFEKQLKYFENHSNVDVVGSSILEFENSLGEEMRYKSIPLKMHEVRSYIKKRNPMNHMTVMFKKKAVIAAGNYQPLSYLEDHYLWLRMLINGCILENIKEPLVYARVGNDFVKRRGTKKYISGWKHLQEMMIDAGYINSAEKFQNMIMIYGFVYMPEWCRKIAYNKILREKPKSECD